MPKRIARQGGAGIVYEDTLVSHADAALFEAGNWADAPVAAGYAGGRGATRFIEHAGQSWVLRHYHRGGRIGRVLDDQFFWAGEARTRCFREWMLLEKLADLGLPSPKPVAARYVRRGPVYTADLITVRIPDVEPWSSRLVRAAPGEPLWRRAGACVAAFHAARVWHADLTAHNLQVDSADRVFLLDFDRGRIRTDTGPWRAGNLARLHRSLTKISRDGSVRFGELEWAWLLSGYEKPT